MLAGALVLPGHWTAARLYILSIDRYQRKYLAYFTIYTSRHTLNVIGI